MKKIYFIAMLLLLAFAFGCTQTSRPSVQRNTLSFLEGYSYLKAEESKYDLSNIDEIYLLKADLENFSSRLDNSTDADALRMFLKFRLALLDAQKNVVLAEGVADEVNCSDSSLKDYISSAITALNSSIKYASEFNQTYPQYFVLTNIDNATFENMTKMINELNGVLFQMQEACR